MQRFVFVMLVSFLPFFVLSCDDSQSQTKGSVCEDPASKTPITLDDPESWVIVGDAGNAADAPSVSGAFPTGAVDYVFEIAKYEVTNTMYAEFLNATAKSSGLGTYSPSNPVPQITQSGTDGDFTYEVAAGAENRPVQRTSYLDATRFANWIENGKPIAPDPNYVAELSQCPNVLRTRLKCVELLQNTGRPFSPRRYSDNCVGGCAPGTYRNVPTIAVTGGGAGAEMEFEFASSAPNGLNSVRITDPGSGYAPGDTLRVDDGTVCPGSSGGEVVLVSSADPGFEPGADVSDFRTAEDTTTENGSAPICASFVAVKGRYFPDVGLRNPGAKFFVPTVDEWYKAAYQDKDRPVVETFVQSLAADGIPIASGVGDYWWDTDDNPASLYQAAVGGASSIGAGAWESGRYINPLPLNSTLYPPSPAVPPMFTDLRDAGGTVTGSFNAGLRSDTMTTVPAVGVDPLQVWIGQQSDFGPVNRFDASGNLLGSFDAGISVDAMTFAGNEVWIGEAVAPGRVRRFALTGNFIDEFNLGITADRSIAMTYTGSEVWVGQSVSGGPIRRFDSNGNLLSQFNSGFAVKSMAFTGTAVVVGWDNNLGPIRIFDLAGNQTGAFDAGIKPDALTFANGEIWVGKLAAPGTLKRLDLVGTEISAVDTGLKLTALTAVGAEVWSPGVRTPVKDLDVWFDANNRNRAYQAARDEAAGIGPGEWERQAKVPTEHYWRFPAGSDTKPVCSCPDEDALHRAPANSANCEGSVGESVDVGSYRDSASPWGTLDQGGNLYEWADQRGAIIECNERMFRGDSFDLEQRPELSYLESSNYYNSCVQKGFDVNGFRLMRLCANPPCN